MKKTILVVSLALVSWGTFAQHNHEGHEHKKEVTEKMNPMFEDKKMEAIYTNYLQVKNALVVSNFKEVRMAAEALHKSLSSFKNGETAKQEAQQIVDASSLESQRVAFSALSSEMVDLVKKSEVSMGEIYVDYCPMANGNKGAFWLSNEKEITNPYYGEKMMKCGSIKETLK